MSGRSSLARRAALAVLLMVGFYVMALAFLAGFVLLLVAEVKTGTSSLFVTVVALVGIFAIVSGIVPRRRRFVAPGPSLPAQEQQRLFDQIRTVADATGSSMPREVYLVGDVNAGVAHVGGFLGIGARPIMIVGLPLMASLTVSEFNGVIAHEFGHYVGGETRMAPLIYRTRETMVRTIASLAQSRHWVVQLLHLPFLWYGRMYLRITQSISRRQELDADAVAARIVGTTSMRSGLVKVHAASRAIGGFMNGELAPLLSEGWRPPIADGFERFLRARAVASQLDDLTDAATREGSADPYDSHPSLNERLRALDDLPREPAPVPDPPALSLLADEPGLEERLLAQMITLDVASLRPMEWDDATSHWLEVWRRSIAKERPALVGITPGRLPAVAADITTFLARVTTSRPDRPRLAVFQYVVGAAMVVALADLGWAIDAAPGEWVTASRGTETIRPFDALTLLLSKELSADAWERTCRDTGIADIDLARVGADLPHGVDVEGGSVDGDPSGLPPAPIVG